MPVGPRVPIDGPAHGTGNSGQCVHALEAMLESQVHQGLQAPAGVRLDGTLPVGDPVCGVPDDQAPEAIVCDDHVAPVSEQVERHPLLARRDEGLSQGLWAIRPAEEIGRPADCEAGMSLEGNAGLQAKTSDSA